MIYLMDPFLCMLFLWIVEVNSENVYSSAWREIDTDIDFSTLLWMCKNEMKTFVCDLYKIQFCHNILAMSFLFYVIGFFLLSIVSCVKRREERYCLLNNISIKYLMCIHFMMRWNMCNIRGQNKYFATLDFLIQVFWR